MYVVPAMLLAGLVLVGCDDAGKPHVRGGDPSQGADLIRQYGCGGCHTIPGITGANGLVGPPLTKMARRVYIAGVLRNSPETMTTWIVDPQRIVPGNAMPDMGISEQDARDITAYLYTLR